MRSGAPPALSSHFYICTTIQRKSLSFPRRSIHLCYNSTKIPQLPALPYAASYVPQSALVPLRLCPPSTTFVLQLNENPSASRAAVHAVVRAAVRSRAPPALSSQYYTFVLQLNENPSASRAAVCPPSTIFVLQIHEHPSTYRAAVRAVVRAVVRAAVRTRAPPALSSQYYICSVHSTKNPSAPHAAVRAVARAAVRSRAPPALSSQYYICTTIQRKSFRFPRCCARRRMRRSPHAPLRLCPPSTTFVLQIDENPSAVRAVVRAALAPLLRLCPPSTTLCGRYPQTLVFFFLMANILYRFLLVFLVSAKGPRKRGGRRRERDNLVDKISCPLTLKPQASAFRDRP